MINLFIYILRHPHEEGIKSYVAILDLAAGHFRRLGSSHPQMATSFPKDIVELARQLADDRSKGPVFESEQALESQPLASIGAVQPQEVSDCFELPQVSAHSSSFTI